ncbi:MAG: hypothetical protein U0T36_00495 [Saprospiraceae bacterium]
MRSTQNKCVVSTLIFMLSILVLGFGQQQKYRFTNEYYNAYEYEKPLQRFTSLFIKKVQATNLYQSIYPFVGLEGL